MGDLFYSLYRTVLHLEPDSEGVSRRYFSSALRLVLGEYLNIDVKKSTMKQNMKRFSSFEEFGSIEIPSVNQISMKNVFSQASISICSIGC